jgi:hypothetical protein
MTNAQLYLAIGLPIVVSLLFNGTLFLWLHGDVRDLRGDLKTLTGKVYEFDNRLTRIEERLGIAPK